MRPVKAWNNKARNKVFLVTPILSDFPGSAVVSTASVGVPPTELPRETHGRSDGSTELAEVRDGRAPRKDTVSPIRARLDLVAKHWGVMDNIGQHRGRERNGMRALADRLLANYHAC